MRGQGISRWCKGCEGGMGLTYHVEHEADETVVCGKGKKDFVHQDDVLEVVYHALTVEIIHGGPEEIPV